MIKKYMIFIIKNLKKRGIAYLCVGIWNTLFSILLYSTLILTLGEHHYLLIGVLNNIICITCAFFLHKFFVFKTKGHVLKQYLKFCSVYFSSSVFGFFILYILVDIFGIPAIFSNILLTGIMFAYCFIGNVFFAFRH